VHSAAPAPSLRGFFEEHAIDGDATHLELVLVVPEKSYAARVAIVAERFACEVVVAAPNDHSIPGVKRDPIVAIVCDPARARMRVAPTAEGVDVDGIRFDVGAPVFVDGGRVARPARVCAPGPESIVDVEVDRVAEADDPRQVDLRFVAPAIGLSVTEVAGFPVDIASQRYFAAQRMTLTVSHAESGATYTFDARDGELAIHDSFVSYYSSGAGLLGRWMLPCNARVVFHGLDFRHPSWFPTGGGCFGAAAVYRACARPCFESLTDEAGELTAAGLACREACRVRAEHVGC
jgi:hypothetical protein